MPGRPARPFQGGFDERRQNGSALSVPRTDPIRTRRKTGVVPKMRYLGKKGTVTEEEYQIMETEEKMRKEEEINRRKAKEAARLAASQYRKTLSVVPQSDTADSSAVPHSSSEQDPYVHAYFAHLKCEGATTQRKAQQQKKARDMQATNEKMKKKERRVADLQTKEAAQLAASQYFGSLSDMPQAQLNTFMRSFFASSSQDSTDVRKKLQQNKLQQKKWQQAKQQQAKQQQAKQQQKKQQQKKQQQKKLQKNISPKNKCVTKNSLDSDLTRTVSHTVQLASAPGARQEDILPPKVAYANAMTLLQYVQQAERKSTLLENLNPFKSKSANDETQLPADAGLLDWDGQCSSLLQNAQVPEQPSNPDHMKLEEDGDPDLSKCKPLGEDLSAEHIDSFVFKAESSYLLDSIDNSVFHPNFVCSQHEIFIDEQNQLTKQSAVTWFPCKICREPFADVDGLKCHMVYYCNYLQIQ